MVKAEGKEFTVIDINKTGYLRVRDNLGKVLELMPDGNQVDFLQGLKISKNV